MSNDAGATPIRFAAVGHAFQALRLPATLHCEVPGGHEWWPLHTARATLIELELELGIEGARYAHNARSFTRVRRTRKPVRAEIHGFSDLFVPVLRDGELVATLVVGPFSTARPSANVILERWRKLSGRQGHLSDSTFAAYLEMCLETPLFEHAQLAIFERLVGQLARLIGGNETRLPQTLESYTLLGQLAHARDAERMWAVVTTMVDPSTPYVWSNAHRVYELAEVGLSEEPDHLVVMVVEAPRSEPVSAVVTTDAMQRALVELARELGNALSGRVGDRGASFVLGTAGTERTRRRRALELSKRARELAHARFGVRLRAGITRIAAKEPLFVAYQRSLRAAEKALGEKASDPVWLDGHEGTAPHSLRVLRKELVADLAVKPEVLPSRFERYLTAVASATGHRLDAARVHLEVAFDNVSDALTSSRVLDERSASTLRASLAENASRADSLQDIFAKYRTAVSELAQATKDPVSARHDRGLALALEYIQQHYTEPLGLSQVAKIAGYNTTYFSELFSASERTSFRKYLSRLRLERARSLLATSNLSASRVGELTGFSSLSSFSHAFHAAYGQAPSEFRAAPRGMQRRARYWAEKNLK